MNALIKRYSRAGKPLLAAAMVSILLVACASAPVSPPGAADARAKLSQLQQDPNLGSRVPVAIREAEAAVRLAEQPVGSDTELGAHRVLMADRKVEIAKARAQTSYTEDQRSRLSDERASAQLTARTREADQARLDADAARAAAARAASDSEREASELRRKIEELEARETDRGLVLTLGDVLFETARSDLKPGATSNLARLASFLNEYPDRTVIIEGHTDSVGSAEYNQALSQRRADAVKSWLVQQGINSQRLSASGKGEYQPIADNNSATGRQMNRRVEVIIENVSPERSR
jgi:outer membrane protein OmpA-like peptidoglycan-associated protein